MSAQVSTPVYSDAPLCRCCEEALCEDGMADADLGPVCLDCSNRLTMAEYWLEVRVRGFSGCQPLGPDSGKGVLP